MLRSTIIYFLEVQIVSHWSDSVNATLKCGKVNAALKCGRVNAALKCGKVNAALKCGKVKETMNNN